MLTSNLKGLLNSLWDRFWSGGIANPLTVMEQINYLLFIRRLDTMDSKNKEEQNK